MFLHLNFKKSFKIIISFTMSLVLIVPFCIIWDYKNVDINCQNGSTESRSAPNKYVINSIEGFGINKSDDNGYYNLSRAEEKDIDILLMGSSNIEGLHVMQSDTLYAKLNQYLPDYYTYNIGKSGHYLPTIVENLEDAINFYKPKKYLIIEVFPDNISDNEIKTALSGNNLINNVNGSEMRLFVNRYFPQIMALNTSRVMWLKKTADVPIAKTVKKESVEDLIKYIKSLENGFKFILFNHPNLNFDSNGDINTNNSNYMSSLKEMCNKYDVYYIEMGRIYEKDYYDNFSYAHGFINSRVDEGHLNEHGLDLIAQEIKKVIENDDALD